MHRSISHEKGRGSLAHNNRDFSSTNVHKDRIKNNVIIKQQSLRAAYDECFGEAVTEYNAKQKRNDRKISDYFEHLFGVSATTTTAKNVLMSKARGKGICTKSYYEDVVQIGDMNDTGNESNPQAAELAKRALLTYINGDKRLNIKSYAARNPNFHVFNAILHMDEATPHLHIDYIPVATGYKGGLSVRNAYNKALAQMGYTGKDCFKNWRDNERDVFRNICRRLGLDPKEKAEEEQSRGTLTPKQYREKIKEADNMAEKIINNAEAMELEARKKARKILSEAEEKANKIIANAEDRVKKIIAEAVGERDRIAEETKENDTPKYSKRNGKEEANHKLEEEYNKMVAEREKYEKMSKQTKIYAQLWLNHIAKTRNPDDIYNNIGDDEPLEEIERIERNKKTA